MGKENLPPVFIEPFAGGAIVGLSVAFEELASQVILVELDEKVSSVWQTIINDGDGLWLAKKIEEFDLTLTNVESVLERDPDTVREIAFQTIVQNRVSRGGILAPGAGLIKDGENGKGIGSRWYPQTLAKRIRDIDKIKSRLQFIRGDAFEMVREYQDNPDVSFFVDPPYTAGAGKRAGSRLYSYSEIDHEELFALFGNVKGDFLITYDDDKYVREIASANGLKSTPVSMKNTHHAEMTELVISKDLDWLN